MTKQELEAEITAVAMAYMDCLTMIEKLEGKVKTRYPSLEEAFNQIPSIPELQDYQQLEEDRQALHAYSMQVMDAMDLICSRESSVEWMFKAAGLRGKILNVFVNETILLSPDKYREIVNRANIGLKEK